MQPTQPTASLYDDRIYPILVTQIYQRSTIGIIATVVNALILVAILWGRIPHGMLRAWFLMILLVSCARALLNRKYLQIEDEKRDHNKWGLMLIAGLAVPGVLWGATGIFLFPEHSVAHQVFIAFVLAGMVGGAVGVFSPLMPVFLSFSIPALAPITIRFLVSGDELHMAMGIMTTLFALLTYLTARNISISTRELVALKETFAEQLDLRTLELKDANDQLAREIAERRQTEKALAESQRQLTDIIEFLPDPTWVIDIDGRVIAWNRAIERLTGIDKKEIVGKDGYAHAVPFYGRPQPMLIDLMLKREKCWDSDFPGGRGKQEMFIASESFQSRVGNDGRYFESTASGLCDLQGNLVGAIASVRDISAARRLQQDREKLIADLRDAIAKVKTLTGLLPICASCKKIRDDKGYWNQIESFISQHSTAEFSHSICPDCAKTLYPDIDFDRTEPRR